MPVIIVAPSAGARTSNDGPTFAALSGGLGQVQTAKESLMANEAQKANEALKEAGLGPNATDQQLRQAVLDEKLEKVTVTPNSTFSDGTFHFTEGTEVEVPKVVEERNPGRFGGKSAKADKSEKVAAHHVAADDKAAKK